MPNLDMIAQIQLGDTPIIQIMKGDVKVWPTYIPPTYYQVTGLLTNVASSTALPSQVEDGHGFTTTLSIAGDYDIITGVSVTMGGNALVGVYNPNTGVINIQEVTGDVVITASAAVVNYSVVAHFTDVSAGTYPDTIRLNRPLTLHLTTDSGYQITSVTVTMGGNAVTGAYNVSTGVVSIAHVTGNVVVEATASAQTYTVTANLTHITSSGAATATGGQSYQATLTPDANYQITSVIVTMGGTTVSGAFNSQTGVLEIQWVEGDISITAVAERYRCGIIRTLTDVTLDNNAEYVAINDPFSCHLVTEPGYVVESGTVKVYMDGVDITEQVRYSDTIYIEHVTGDVEIVASAVLAYIQFEDATVKNICVSNWGGGTYAREITKQEAAAATSLNAKFYQNSSITKFTELRYFTGLTSLDYDGVRGQFYNCRGLTQVMLPAANITSLLAAFRDTRIVNIDTTPLTSTTINIRNMNRGNTALKTITLKGISYNNNWGYTFDGCTALTTINIDGTANLNNVANYESTFNNCTKLANINGTLTNIKKTINFKSCPLTVASAITVLNGLATASSVTVTFKSSMRGAYEANTDFITARDAAIARGWAVSYE